MTMTAATSLEALNSRVRHDLSLLTLPAARWVPERETVSYTHLTLPTICSV